MAEDFDSLTKLTASIADGESIDWDALRAAAPGDDVRRLLDHLRVVAGVADVHRSQADDSLTDHLTVTAASLRTGPGGASPARWGHLLLIRKIGEGAFGEVYEALDTWLDHPRALKLLRPEVATRAAAPQILHEARKLARVRHPNVVTVHGADRHDGRVGFWMDLIQGETLEQMVKRSRLSAGEATHVGQELCSALAAVHHAQLLHRDIKAQNVMRAADGGRIILMDFGAGEVLGAPSEGRAQGTPLYLAPEMFDGAPATVQTDIYALGVLLYYLVTGRFPVEGRSLPDIAVAHLRNRRRLLQDERPDLPDQFVSIIERAIDRDPARRFESAGDFHVALREYAPAPRRPVPVPNPPIPLPIPPPVPVPQRARALQATGAALAAVPVSGFIASRTFEVAFHVPPGFTPGPMDYFRLGTEALVPFVIYWTAGAALVALFAATRRAFPRWFRRAPRAVERRIAAIPAASLAALLAVAGAACLAAVTWGHWRLFAAIVALQSGDAAAARGLEPWFGSLFLSHSQFSAFLSFLLVFAVWRWGARLEQAGDDPATVRGMKWVTVAIAAVTVMLAVAPRRIAMDEFPVVQRDGRPAFVVGTNGDELLLYSPGRADTVHQRVRRDAPGLVMTGTSRKLVPAPDAPDVR